jgi:hypothetical protein
MSAASSTSLSSGGHLTGARATLMPFPRNSSPMRFARSDISCLSQDAAAVDSEGNCVMKSVYLGPAADQGVQ